MHPCVGPQRFSFCCSPWPRAPPRPWGAAAGIELVSVTVFGRGVIDIGVSAVTGRDCSIVRLDKGQTYCAPPDTPLHEQYCTRTLAVVDCWAAPQALEPRGPAVAETPAPTLAQTDYRAARWPKSLTTLP